MSDANYEFEFFRTFRWGKNVTSFGGFAKQTNWEVETLKETFDILDKTFDELVEAILERIPEIATWIPGSFEELIDLILEKIPPIPSIDDIITWVSDAFESILDKLFEEGE